MQHEETEKAASCIRKLESLILNEKTDKTQSILRIPKTLKEPQDSQVPQDPKDFQDLKGPRDSEVPETPKSPYVQCPKISSKFRHIYHLRSCNMLTIMFFVDRAQEMYKKIYLGSLIALSNCQVVWTQKPHVQRPEQLQS